MEEEKVSEEISFLDELWTENEKKADECLEEIRALELKKAELELSKKETEQEIDQSISFFSPIGVLSKKEKGETSFELDKIKAALQGQKDLLDSFQRRKNQLKDIRVSLSQNVKKRSEQNKEPVDEKKALQILETQEYDRNRIARDLHDSSVQSLTNLVHKTEFCMRLLDMDKVRVKLELQTMIESVKGVINDMRSIIFNLRPTSIHDFGLNTAIETFCQQIKTNYEIIIDLKLPEEELSFPQIKKITLYRILQEACNNVTKHAKATRMEISLSEVSGKINLLVKDNGIGFSTVEIKNGEEHPCFGLSIMRERTELLGGEIQVSSSQNEGTTIHVEIPGIQETEKINE